MKNRRLVAAGLTAVATVAFSTVGGGVVRAQEQVAPVTPGQVPTAEQPLLREVPEPRFSFEGGAGILGFVGDAAAVGPAWNVRVIGTITPRFAGELSYTGAANEANRINDTIVMTGIDASLRYNILRPAEAPVQPFVTAGIGYVGWSGEGGDPFALAIPLSAGVERMLTRHVKLGARFNFKPAFFDELGEGEDAPGGDTWNLIANVGGRF